MTNDFAPWFYALLTSVVTSAFAWAGHISWWSVALTAVIVYVWERLRQREGRA